MTQHASDGGRGGGDDVAPIIMWAVIGAALIPVIFGAVHAWALPRLTKSSSDLARWAVGWWHRNWWLVAFCAAGLVAVRIYSLYLRRRTARRREEFEAVEASFKPVVSPSWSGKLMALGWRGSEPTRIKLVLPKDAPVDDHEWRTKVAATARKALGGAIERVEWPKGHPARRSWRRRLATVEFVAVMPLRWWQRLLAAVKGSGPGEGEDDAPAKGAPEELLVRALAGLVPKPAPEVGPDGTITVRYGETTRDQSPHWRGRVLDQVSARMGEPYRGSWDRRRRCVVLEPVPELAFPVAWADRWRAFREVCSEPWVAPYGTDENGNFVAWQPGDRETHALLTGKPGNGKTATIKTIINSLLLQGAAVAIIDPKRVDFTAYHGRPGVVFLATDPADQAGALVDLEAEMMRRSAAAGLRRLVEQHNLGDELLPPPGAEDFGTAPLIVVLDELTYHAYQVQTWWASLSGEERQEWGANPKEKVPPMREIPTRIVALSRAVKIHVLLGVQRADGPNFGSSTAMRENIKHHTSLGQQEPLGSEMQWGDRRVGSEVVVAHPGQGLSNGLRISRSGQVLGRGSTGAGDPGRFGGWYTAQAEETEEFWAEVAKVAPDTSLIKLPNVSAGARDPKAAAEVLRQEAYGRAGSLGLVSPVDPAAGGHTAADVVPAGAAVEPAPSPAVLTLVPPPKPATVSESGVDEGLIERAARLVVAEGKGSANLVQRELRVGYERAKSVMEILEDRGVVGPVTGRKARRVLLDEASLDAMFGPVEAEEGSSDEPAVVIPPVSPPSDGPAEADAVGPSPESWESALPSQVEVGDVLRFGDIDAGEVLEPPEPVVDEFDGSDLTRVVLSVEGEDQVVDLNQDEEVMRRTR